MARKRISMKKIRDIIRLKATSDLSDWGQPLTWDIFSMIWEIKIFDSLLIFQGKINARNCVLRERAKSDFRDLSHVKG